MTVLDWVEWEVVGRAWRIVREVAGKTHEDVYDKTGIPIVWMELLEDWGEQPDFSQLDSLAEVYGYSPGTLLDTVLMVAEAESRDPIAEMEDEEEADRLLKLLREHPLGVTNEMMEEAGISSYNAAPLNVLHNRGLKIEQISAHVPQRTTYQRPIGVKLLAS